MSGNGVRSTPLSLPTVQSLFFSNQSNTHQVDVVLPPIVVYKVDVLHGQGAEGLQSRGHEVRCENGLLNDFVGCRSALGV